MLGKRSFNKTPIAAIIIKGISPLKGWTSVRSVKYSSRALLIISSDDVSEEACQETVRILCAFSEQLPKATVPCRLALEYSTGLYPIPRHGLI